MLSSLPLGVVYLALLVLPVDSRLQDPRPFFHRAATQARHHVLARAHQAHVLARDVRIAVLGLSTSSQSGAVPVQLVKRSARSCKLNNSTSAIPANAAGGNTSTSYTASARATATGSHTGSTPKSTSTPIAGSSPFKLVASYTGNDFFNEWDFDTGSDPTHGVVDYLTGDEAKAAGLAFVKSNGNFVMQVDTTPVVSNLRKSVRINSQRTFNGGLLLMDSVHMPTGCGTWPAWWSNGPDWPNNGEIDIIEGVSDYIDNQATVHTRHGCNMPASFNDPSSFSQVATGQLVGGTNCAAPETNNQGCGVRILDDTSFGPGFNSNGGGVYSMHWNTDGIAIHFFTRNKIPDDITSGNPDPSQWGLPAAMWPASACDPFTFFKDHVAIFDTTLCGDWAGNVWGDSGIPGQEQSCATRTGVSNCKDYVLSNGASFKEAYWEVSYVKLYQAST